jgi:ABC-type dipeptide/oligopeptide/nickel transport system permease component
MNQMEQSPAVTVLLRVLAGIGGAIILLTFALFTLGAGLGAPIGIIVARRRARRRDRPFTRAASWFAAVMASIITAGLVLVVVFALAPTSPLREFQNGAIKAQAAQDTATTPAWLRKAFPQTARSDSAAKEIMKNPGWGRAFTG